MRQPHSLTKFDIEQCDSFGKRIAMHISLGNFNAARDVLEKAELELTGKSLRLPAMELPLAAIGLAVKTVNAIEKHLGAIYVGELVRRFTPKQLELQANIGRRTVQEVRLRLEELGVEWDDEYEDAV